MGSIQALACAGTLIVAGCAPACPLAGQSAVREVRLYFGHAIPGGGTVGTADWRTFADAVLTPAFPDGFTTYDATGAWRDREGHAVREATSVVEVFGDVPADRVARVVEAYRQKFHQEAVGVVNARACAAF